MKGLSPIFLPATDFRSTHNAMTKRIPTYRQKKKMTVNGLNIISTFSPLPVLVGVLFAEDFAYEK